MNRSGSLGKGRHTVGGEFLLSSHCAQSSLQDLLEAKCFLTELGFQTFPQCLTYLWHWHHHKQGQLDYSAPSKAPQFICLDMKNLDNLVCHCFISPSSRRRQAPWILNWHELMCIHLSYPPPTTIVVLLFSGSVWLCCDPMDYSLPGSSVHGILHLERVAISFSVLLTRDETHVSCTVRPPESFGNFTHSWAMTKNLLVYASSQNHCPQGYLNLSA